LTRRNPAIEGAKGKISDDSGGRSGMNSDPYPHKYNGPLLSPKEFLLAVMRDPTVDLEQRIDAAVKLLPLIEVREPPPPYCGITYYIPESPELRGIPELVLQ
jgi:hypothetical protein